MTTPPQEQPLVKTNRSSVRDLLQGADFRRELARVLPRHLTAERFIRVALTATMRTPKLLDCSRESLFKCLLDLSAIGLEPDGRRAHLIPFGKEVQLIIDYKGIVELIRRSGDVSTVHCDVVGMNDHFEYRFGTGAKLEHVPNIHDRGELYATYSFVKLKDGTEEFDVMSIEEVARVRARSRAANDGPWKTDFPEMAKKTVFRRHSKWLPLSAETRAALETDDEPLTEQERFQHAEPARARVAEPPAESPRRGRPPKQPAEKSAPTDLENDSPFVEKEEPSHNRLDVELIKRLDAIKATPNELLELCRRIHLADKNVTAIAELSEQTVRLLLEDWDTAAEQLAQLKAGTLPA
jgi:recombination protein RecT